MKIIATKKRNSKKGSKGCALFNTTTRSSSGGTNSNSFHKIQNIKERGREKEGGVGGGGPSCYGHPSTSKTSKLYKIIFFNEILLLHVGQKPL